MRTVILAAVILISNSVFAQGPEMQMAIGMSDYAAAKIQIHSQEKTTVIKQYQDATTRVSLFSSPVVNYLNTPHLNNNEVAAMYNMAVSLKTSSGMQLQVAAQKLSQASIDLGIGSALFVFGDYKGAAQSFQISVYHSSSASHYLMDAYMNLVNVDLILNQVAKLIGT